MKLSTKKNDGVSPVIGTILLVAITVVLVAIIAAVVMGMTGDIGSAKIVGVQATSGSQAGQVNVTFTGGSGITSLQSAYVYLLDNATFAESRVGDVTVTGATIIIGKEYTATFPGASGNQKISVVGVFADGNQTLLQTTVNIK